MSQQTPAVYAAIAKAIQMAAGIALKWQDGAGGKTKGRKSEDLRRLMVQVLPQCGLVIIPGAVRLVERTNEKTSSGGSMFHHCIEQEFIIASTEDGSTVTGGSAGSGMDMGDKYTSKATTYAMKNFVLNLLQIPSEAMEDDEIYGQELLSEAQLKELSSAIAATYSKEAAFKYLRARIGVDDISRLTAAQFGQAMELIGSVPKPDDVMMPAQKDKFYRELISKKHIPVDLLNALGYEDSKLTFKQRNEIEAYIETDAYKASKEKA